MKGNYILSNRSLKLPWFARRIVSHLTNLLLKIPKNSLEFLILSSRSCLPGESSCLATLKFSLFFLDTLLARLANARWLRIIALYQSWSLSSKTYKNWRKIGKMNLTGIISISIYVWFLGFLDITCKTS